MCLCSPNSDQLKPTLHVLPFDCKQPGGQNRKITRPTLSRPPAVYSLVSTQNIHLCRPQLMHIMSPPCIRASRTPHQDEHVSGMKRRALVSLRQNCLHPVTSMMCLTMRTGETTPRPPVRHHAQSEVLFICFLFCQKTIALRVHEA